MRYRRAVISLKDKRSISLRLEWPDDYEATLDQVVDAFFKTDVILVSASEIQGSSPFTFGEFVGGTVGIRTSEVLAITIDGRFCA